MSPREKRTSNLDSGPSKTPEEKFSKGFEQVLKKSFLRASVRVQKNFSKKFPNYHMQGHLLRIPTKRRKNRSSISRVISNKVTFCKIFKKNCH